MDFLNNIRLGTNRSPAYSESRVSRDLRLNFQMIAESGNLNDEELSMLVLCTASALGMYDISEAAAQELRKHENQDVEIKEIMEIPALMSMLGVYYGFTDIMKREGGGNIDEAYKKNKLQMSAFKENSIGIANFEMLCFAISVMNGCASCVSAQEKELRALGFSAEKVHDIVRLVSIVKGIKALDTVCMTDECMGIVH